jgi:hypothetical protein
MLCLAHCFPLRIELVFERNISHKSSCSRWGKAHFVRIDLFSLVEETHVPLQKTQPVLESGASSTLLPCEN